MIRKLRIAPFLVILSLSVSGCADLLTQLRRNLDEDYGRGSATYGGPMAEGGFLSETMGEGGYRSDQYEHADTSNRGIASETAQSAESESWLDGFSFGDQTLKKNYNVLRNDPVPPPAQSHYKKGMRATRSDFIDESPNEGSLWASDGQTNYYFTRNKIRVVGDIISLSLEEAMIRDMGLEVKSKLSSSEMDRELEQAQRHLRRRAPAVAGKEPDVSLQNGANRSGEDEIQSVTEADVDLTKSLEVKSGDVILAEIIERYPNGNYKIKGTKRIIYKNGAPRVMTVLGVVRGTDINDEDVVSTGKLYEYRLEANI